MALLALQTLHTAILATSVAFIIWLWVCLVTGCAGRWMIAGWLWPAVIGLSLLANDGVCPLQDLARWVTASKGYVRDMLTPIWFNNLAVPLTAPPALIAMSALVWREARRIGGDRLI